MTSERAVDGERPQETLLRMFDEAARWPSIRAAIRDVLKPEEALAATRGEPPEPGPREALQAVWDLGDELDSNHARFAAATVAERFGLDIDAHNRFSDPPRNRNEEQLAECRAEVDRLRAALPPVTEPVDGPGETP